MIADIRESEAFQAALAHKKPLVDEELFAEILRGMIENRAQYLEMLRPLLDRDEKDVSPIEKSILLTVCHELAAMPHIPYPVVINEAVEVAKTFGGTEGYKFINGIADKLAEKLRPNDPTRRTPAAAL